MDLSSLLTKQLAEKKQKRQKQKQNDQKLDHVTIRESSSIPGSDANPDIEATSESSVSTPILSNVDEEKLTQGLSLFNENEENQSKEDQLRKLQIHVNQEKKDLRYKAYLDKENGVDASLQLSDIGEQREEKLSLQIRKFFKEILKTWSSTPTDDFPQSILNETKRDIVKLLYKLRSGKLPSSTIVSLSTIVFYIQTESFTKANEAYLKLSIGNVAWPIGVRDVGIHARAADAKIAGDDKKQLANIMKSEATRRWLIAVKRIVNYCASLHGKKKGGATN